MRPGTFWKVSDSLNLKAGFQGETNTVGLKVYDLSGNVVASQPEGYLEGGDHKAAVMLTGDMSHNYVTEIESVIPREGGESLITIPC